MILPMHTDTAPTLTPNTATIIELTGTALTELRNELAERPHTLRVMLEVEPDGAACVKFKSNEYTWTPPHDRMLGATARVERLY